MANWQWVTRIHRSLYRASAGRIGARLAGMDMLLLTATGRRSGGPRTLPLACFAWEDAWVVVASNNGQDRDPAWWLNLEKDPNAWVQRGADRWPVVAERAEGEVREELWPWLKQQNPAYVRYEARTDREIPVVVLRPTS